MRGFSLSADTEQRRARSNYGYESPASDGAEEPEVAEEPLEELGFTQFVSALLRVANAVEDVLATAD